MNEESSFSELALRALLGASEEGLIVFDGDERCRMIGRRAEEMFGIDAVANVGQSAAKVLGACAAACDEPEAFLRAADEASTSATELDLCRPLPRRVLCRVARMAAGRVVFVRDVTLEHAAASSTRQLRARLRALMPYDGLTGLPGQRRFFDELAREHSRCMRAWDSYAVLRIDVDGMKSINAEFTLSAGDQLLEQVARRIETCVREYDVLARLEEDEFGVLLPGADRVAVRAVAERMTAAMAKAGFALVGSVAPPARHTENDTVLRLAEPLFSSERTMSVSIGGALWVPPSPKSAEATFRSAGDALRDARNSGPGQMCLETS
jgi:diguanylate cyclase (GGDEF)-like protein